MNQHQVGLAWHQTLFRLACAERTGSEFQSLFEQIMEKVDPCFVKVKPSGREGDWKCDGWIPESGTCFQVYAPEELTVAKAAAKVKEDLDGAVAHWGDQMKSWIFVWSSRERGLEPKILACINKAASEHAGLIIDQWGRERLWGQVEGLSEFDRSTILGPPPALDQVTATTSHEVQALMTYIAEQPIPDLDDDLGGVDLEKKMDVNEFDDAVRLLIKAALPIVPTVQQYVSDHPDPRYSQRVAVSLSADYEQLRESSDGDANAVFAGLIERLGRGSDADLKTWWAAVAIVAHYFELCDIFER